MFEIMFCIGALGLACAVFGVGYSLFILFMYSVYRLDGGKMPLREYFKHW